MLRANYWRDYGSNFIKLCKNEDIVPRMDKIFAFFRFGSPVGLFPAHDTQFYMYFCDYEKIDLNLNQDEFTEYKWLAVDEALDLY